VLVGVRRHTASLVDCGAGRLVLHPVLELYLKDVVCLVLRMVAVLHATGTVQWQPCRAGVVA
jgi:hypothetical protein